MICLKVWWVLNTGPLKPLMFGSLERGIVILSSKIGLGGWDSVRELQMGGITPGFPGGPSMQSRGSFWETGRGSLHTWREEEAM